MLRVSLCISVPSTVSTHELLNREVRPGIPAGEFHSNKLHAIMDQLIPKWIEPDLQGSTIGWSTAGAIGDTIYVEIHFHMDAPYSLGVHVTDFLRKLEAYLLHAFSDGINPVKKVKIVDRYCVAYLG